MFATCYRTPAGSKCLHRDLLFKIIKGPAKADPEGGVVQSVAEKPVKTLMPKVAVMPSGAYSVGAETEDNGRTKAVLWERNGLRHGEFVISGVDGLQVTQLAWTLDASILAVGIKNSKTGEMGVALYQRTNFKWYKKLHIRMGGETGQFRWMGRKGRLMWTGRDGVCSVLEVDTCISGTTGRVQAEQDFAGVAVTDVDCIWVSHFDKSVVPPPMSNYTLPLPNGQTHVLKLCYSSRFLAALTYESIMLFPVADYQHPVTVPLDAQLQVEMHKHGATQFLFLLETAAKEACAVLCVPSEDPDKDRLFLLRIALEDNKIIGTNVVTIKKVACMCPSADYLVPRKEEEAKATNAAYLSPESSPPEGGSYIFVQHLDKSVHYVSLQATGEETVEFIVPAQLFAQMVPARVGGHEGMVGLTQNMKLYINATLFSPDVTSFLVSETLLFFTKSTPGTSHLLYIYDLSAELPLPSVSHPKLPLSLGLRRSHTAHARVEELPRARRRAFCQAGFVQEAKTGDAAAAGEPGDDLPAHPRAVRHTGESRRPKLSGGFPRQSEAQDKPERGLRPVSGSVCQRCQGFR